MSKTAFKVALGLWAIFMLFVFAGAGSQPSPTTPAAAKTEANPTQTHRQMVAEQLRKRLGATSSTASINYCLPLQSLQEKQDCRASVRRIYGQLLTKIDPTLDDAAFEVVVQKVREAEIEVEARFSR
jgi:hypothetical protein